MKKSQLVSVLVLFILLCVGCGKKSHFSEFHTIDSAKWLAGRSYNVMFRGDSKLESQELVLLINTNSDFKSDSICFMLEIMNSDRRVWDDSITLNMSSCVNILKKQYNEITIAENCDFSNEGVYRFKIKNISQSFINGVEEIGIAIK